MTHSPFCELLAASLLRDGIPFPDIQVLSTADGNKDLIRIDPLQRLHTLTNLSEQLAGGVPGVPRTLRDDLLQSQAEEIRQVSATSGRQGASQQGLPVLSSH